jgi:hypothetical protein
MTISGVEARSSGRKRVATAPTGGHARGRGRATTSRGATDREIVAWLMELMDRDRGHAG